VTPLYPEAGPSLPALSDARTHYLPGSLEFTGKGTERLIVILSDRLGVEISPAEFDREQWATPARIVQYFEARLGV
jgi:hypothetical protein